TVMIVPAFPVAAGGRLAMCRPPRFAPTWKKLEPLKLLTPVHVLFVFSRHVLVGVHGGTETIWPWQTPASSRGSRHSSFLMSCILLPGDSGGQVHGIRARLQ